MSYSTDPVLDASRYTAARFSYSQQVEREEIALSDEKRGAELKTRREAAQA